MECIPARKRPLWYAEFPTLIDWAIVQALANQLDKVRTTRPKSYILQDCDNIEYCHLTKDYWIITGPVPNEILADAAKTYCSRVRQIAPKKAVKKFKKMVLNQLKKRAFKLLRMQEGPKGELPILC